MRQRGMDDHIHILRTSTCLAPDARGGKEASSTCCFRISFGFFFHWCLLSVLLSEHFVTLALGCVAAFPSPRALSTAEHLPSTARILPLCRSAQPALTKLRLKMVLSWDVFSVLSLVSQMETSMNCSFIDQWFSPCSLHKQPGIVFRKWQESKKLLSQ